MFLRYRPSPEAALFLMTIIWGGTFLAIHIAIEFGGPLYFVGFRFGAAALFTAIFAKISIRSITRNDWLGGVVIGVFIFLGYGLQTAGLQTIASSKSAFITAFAVPIIPLLQWVILRSRPRLNSWLGIVLAFCGLVLIAAPDASDQAIDIGVVLTILSAIAIAFEVIMISLFASKVNLWNVTFVQLLITSLLSFCLIPIFNEAPPTEPVPFLGIAVILGLASAVIQLTMNWAQKSISATRATVLYSGEPVWAGIIGRLAGERLPSLALLGGAMIITAMLVSELAPKKKRQ